MLPLAGESFMARHADEAYCPRARTLEAALKVLQVLYSGLGGHGSVVTSLVAADRRREWEHSLLFYGIEDLLPAYRAFCEQREIPFTLVRKKRGLFSIRLAAVYRALRRNKTDVVILHSTPLFAPVWLYCLFSGAQLVVVEHTANQVKSRSEWVASFLTLLLATRLVYLTPRYLREMQRKFGKLVNLNRVAVIQNGIDTETFSPRLGAGDGKGNEIRFGMAGRFSSPKNQMLLVKTFLGMFKDQRFGRSVSLHLAGIGENWQQVKEEIEASGMQERFVLTGLLDERGLVEFLRGLDVYVHASQAENMCTSVMQAMSCGLPVVASNIDGIRELMISGESGFFFENRDAASLETTLVRLAGDEALRTRIGMNARRRAVERFSSRQMFAGYQEAISAAGDDPTISRKTSA